MSKTVTSDARAARPLQNRVDPFGTIHAVSARGMFTGNRGIIHDPETRTLLRKRWTNPAWIICVLHLPGREPRKPMGYNGPGGGVGWTELFFLDEVTALAAGHRPCFYCQRQRAQEFLGRFGDAFAIAGPKAADLDRRLHGERFASSQARLPEEPAAQNHAMSGTEVPTPPTSSVRAGALWIDSLASLPDGATIASGRAVYAVRAGRLLPWSFGGYGTPVSPADVADPCLVTPPTTLATLRAGYRPAWHPSAE
ncbi:MAG: hypothetical protein KF723_04590 [Rhizobiaceae bacterium]|nr:hypothetical protein [Rhizobiaceae bacterium]